MRYVSSTLLAGCVLAGLSFCRPAQATELLTTNVQGAGANWTAAIWRTNNGAGVPTGPAVVAIAGNTYRMLADGVSIGNALTSTRTRSPAVSGVTSTFPGDSLTVGTNTELRFKQSADNNPALVTTCNYPGVGGNAGLILNGGLLNCGSDGTVIITGKVDVASQSYISHGAGGGGGGLTANLRAVNFTGVLGG